MPNLLLTGANRGLGLEFAKQYATAGWRVFATCRAPDKASELQAVARSSSGRVSVHGLEVADRAQVQAFARSFDDLSVDLLLNNAGTFGPKQQDPETLDEAAWVSTLQVNTMAPLWMASAFRAHVQRSEKKQIVTITSGMGSISDNTLGGWVAYRSSKAAVNMVMKNLALELKSSGITVLLLNPGWVKTDMGGDGATLAPAESISGMRTVIEGLSLSDSGRFLNYNGAEYAW